MNRRPSIALYAVLVAGALVMLLPIVWMLLTSLKTFPEILRNPPALLRSSGDDDVDDD